MAAPKKPKKTTAKKATKPAAKKPTAKKATAKKPTAKKPAAKAVAKKTVAKKATAKKAVAKKTVAKKTVAKKTVAKKTVAKKVTRAPRKKATPIAAPAVVAAPAASAVVAAPAASAVVAAPAASAVVAVVAVVAAPPPPPPPPPPPAVTIDPVLHQQRLTHIQGKSITDLKTMLRTNDQVTTGTKTELVARVLDRVEHGNLPRCPKCYIGRLRVTSSGYTCPGGYDDDEYKGCDFNATFDEVQRPDWQFATANLA